VRSSASKNRLTSPTYNDSIVTPSIPTMFAPPPVQLSRAEIEARIKARRKGAVAAGPLNRITSASSGEEQDRGSLHGSASPVSPRPSRSSNSEKFKVSRPIATSSSRVGLEDGRAAWEKPTGPPLLTSGFAERPRKAPIPPKRSTAPPDEWFTQSKSPSSSLPNSPSQDPPVVPAKSPKRKKSSRLRPPSEILRSLQDDPLKNVGTFSEALAKLKSKDGGLESVRLFQPARSMTAPAAPMGQESIKPPGARSSRLLYPKDGMISYVEGDSRASTMSTAISRLSAVRGSRIDKSSKRLSDASAIRAALLDLDELYSFATPRSPPKRVEGDVNVRSSSLPDLPLPWRRQRRGETMSVLLDAGFFPVGTSDRTSNVSAVLGVKVPPPLALVHKELPPTPTSIMATPTELYQNGIARPLAPRPLRPAAKPRKAGRPGNKRRSPLSQVSTNAQPNGAVIYAEPESLEASRLSSIPENVPNSENSPAASGISTPVAKQIHLRGGSVVTVCPPELTAWQRTIYIQGPIKLPKPVIVPRKNSVASLEPFQEAVDHVYQEALHIPRRRSDEHVVDDVCEFFDDFGFDEIGYTGDLLCTDHTMGGVELEDSDEETPEMERFSTPPVEPEVSPVEKVVAKEIVQIMSKPAPTPMPPVETEESLRARGIARLSHKVTAAGLPRHDRKDSLTLTASPPKQIPLIPEGAILNTAAATANRLSADSDTLTEKSPVDVQEMDSPTSWIVPGALSKFFHSSKGLTQAMAPPQFI
jgi:hypothetical protein